MLFCSECFEYSSINTLFFLLIMHHILLYLTLQCRDTSKVVHVCIMPLTHSLFEITIRRERKDFCLTAGFCLQKNFPFFHFHSSKTFFYFPLLEVEEVKNVSLKKGRISKQPKYDYS